MAMIRAAAGNASSYSENLATVSQQLGAGADEPGVRAIVASLVHATKEMEKNNHALEERLAASKQEIDALQENLQTVRTESLTDPLTALANRKYLDEALLKAVGQAHAEGEPLSLLMMDVDHFKLFNDSYGHPIGDHVLRLVAMSMRQNVRGQDTAARYGGEEFVVVLPGTPLAGAITVADHIRCAVMSKELIRRSTGEHLGRVTISLGAAALRPGDTPQRLLERADSCLYAAKRKGRNCVVGDGGAELTASPKVA
jgi:diguanylate cyclase